MRLIAVLLLVACAALAVVCAITAWQAGGPGAFEVMCCLGIIFVLCNVIPAAWRRDGPVHEGGEDTTTLRPMSDSDRAELYTDSTPS